MATLLLAIILVLNAIVLLIAYQLLRRSGSSRADETLSQIIGRVEQLDGALSQKFTSATADMAHRLEQSKGDLRQQMTDRLAAGFQEMQTAVGQQLAAGRSEQSGRLDHFTGLIETKFESLRNTTQDRLDGFAERQADSLKSVSATLEQKFDQLSTRQAENLESIRSQVDSKLMAITQQVQQKLDDNIKEGFAQFEKVQQHLKAAEEQLRQVGTIGDSINDLNNLLKLPHLRGKFGEASLERLLSDFLPANMYELQASPAEGAGRADVLIQFPEAKLPVDAKFPREQVLPLFESNDAAEIAEARENFARVMRIEARRIAGYISPENGTTEIALMYLPSETLYLEAIRNPDLTDALEKLKVFPVSPNTLLMTLKTIGLVYKWYQVAMKFEETRAEVGKARKSLEFFQSQFDKLGDSLGKAQEAYNKAATHLKNYRVKVTSISGDEGPSQLELPEPKNALKAGAGE